MRWNSIPSWQLQNWNSVVFDLFAVKFILLFYFELLAQIEILNQIARQVNGLRELFWPEMRNLVEIVRLSRNDTLNYQQE